LPEIGENSQDTQGFQTGTQMKREEIFPLPTQLEINENFIRVYGNQNLGCEYKIRNYTQGFPLSENQGNFTCVYVNQTSECEYKISPISDRAIPVYSSKFLTAWGYVLDFLKLGHIVELECLSNALQTGCPKNNLR
jgi:hypothetical protein